MFGGYYISDMSERLIASLMKQTSLLTHEGASCSDARLLEQFVACRDESAFSTLVRRHAPMVWAVCRNALYREADAEDAFQATFLALVKQAHRIRRSAAIGAWLHTTAVRICLTQRRSQSRRIGRETRVARSESAMQQESSWSDELAHAHDAIRQLPRREHEVFVLCMLEGQPQKVVARRLGLQVNSVSGLLARATKRLRSKLQSSGTISLGALAVAASCPAAVPASLLLQTCRLVCPTTALSKTILFLSTSVVESTMRKALLLTLVTFTLGVGITTGRWFVGSSDAQDPFQQHAGQPPASVYHPPAQSYYSVNLPLSTWEYKVLMGDGNASVESKLNSLGGAGWELCTASSTLSDQMMFVFKRLRKPTTQTEERRFQPVEKQAQDVYFGKNRFSQGAMSYEPAVTSKTTSTINIPLQHTDVNSMSLLVKDIFEGCKVSAETRTNSLVIQGPSEMLTQVKKLVERLDRLGVNRANQGL